MGSLSRGTKADQFSYVPAGTVLPFAGAVAPDGWALCDGTTVSRTDYAELYVAIGDAWGNGDGSTTFHLPDLRGRFLRGADNGAGRDPDSGTRTTGTGGNIGDAVGSVQDDVMQGHKHSTNRLVGARAGRDAIIDSISNTALANDLDYYSLTSIMDAAPASDGLNGTPRTSSETRPANVNMNYIIKL